MSLFSIPYPLKDKESVLPRQEKEKKLKKIIKLIFSKDK